MNVTFKFLELKQMQWSLFHEKEPSNQLVTKSEIESWKYRRQHKASIFSALKDKSE